MRRIVLVLAALFVLTAACGDSGDDTKNASTTLSSDATPSTTAPVVSTAATTTTLAAITQPTTLSANLTPGEVVGTQGGRKGASGRIVFTLKPATNELCFAVTLTNIQPNAAHIHEGKAGVAGPVVVDLVGAPMYAMDSRRTYCNARVDGALLTRLAREPSSFYADLHESGGRDGSARGQLTPGG